MIIKEVVDIVDKKEKKEKKSKDKFEKKKEKCFDFVGVIKEKKDKKKDKVKQEKFVCVVEVYFNVEVVVVKVDSDVEVDLEDFIKFVEEFVLFVFFLVDDKIYKKIYKFIKKGVCIVIVFN